MLNKPVLMKEQRACCVIYMVGYTHPQERLAQRFSSLYLIDRNAIYVLLAGR
jgi:hypothetical protein